MIYELKEYEFFEYFACFFHLTLIGVFVNKKVLQKGSKKESTFNTQ